MPGQHARHRWTLPRELRPELAAYISEVAADIDSHGRASTMLDYVAALIDRDPTQKYAAAFGGSRSKRYESARKLLTRSPWSSTQLQERRLIWLQRLMRNHDLGRPALTMNAMGLRRRLDDDEPRYNFIVAAVAFPDHVRQVRLEFPLVAMIVGTREFPTHQEMLNGQIHLLDHLPKGLAHQRILPFAAISFWARFRLRELGWQYIQAIPDSASEAHRIRFCRHGEPVMDMQELSTHVTDENVYKRGVVIFNGEISAHGDVPDWEEIVIAQRHELLNGPEITWHVTNGEPDEATLDVAQTAAYQPSIEGQLDLLGAGIYRGPSRLACTRHLILVELAACFVVGRAAQGCPWGLRRQRAAVARNMDRFLRESAATGTEISDGERSHAEAALRRVIWAH